MALHRLLSSKIIATCLPKTLATPSSSKVIALASSRHISSTRFVAGSNDFPWENQPTGDSAALEDGAGLDPPGTPWTPAPVAEDYEETISLLLGSQKVDDAIDIFGRMIKRGFRPSSEIVDELYSVAKTKPEWQAAAVKTINSIDLSAMK